MCQACVNAAQNKRRQRDPVAHAAARRKAYAADPLKMRSQQMKAMYGITLAQYDDMLLAQGMGCAICESKISRQGNNRLNIDHDHKTEKIRGILCSPCNTALGKFRDDPALLRKAALYLEQQS